MLCPTRELADQVSKHIRKLATGIANLKLLTLTGGMPLGPQLASLAHEPHVVVGTPGRVQELLRKQALDLRGVRTLVLDEADRMLDMGFEEPIREIIGKTPKDRQTLLFSATYPDAIREIGRKSHARSARGHRSTRRRPGRDRAAVHRSRRAPEARGARRPAARTQPGIRAWCSATCDATPTTWRRRWPHVGFSALALHGDMEQRDRDEVLVQFANRSCNVLVASDVAARGLDIDDLAAVINYELPTDPDVYVHRIGRTGRAGRKGLALSLVRAARDAARAAAGSAQRRAAALDARRRSPTCKTCKAPPATMTTLRIDAGRSDKLRPGDIVGALTGDAGLKADAIGKIDVFATRSYVAIVRQHADKALAKLQAGRIKGRNFRVRRDLRPKTRRRDTPCPRLGAFFLEIACGEAQLFVRKAPARNRQEEEAGRETGEEAVRQGRRQPARRARQRRSGPSQRVVLRLRQRSAPLA